MRKSIIAGLTLCAALAFAGQAQAEGDEGGASSANRGHHGHKHHSRLARTRSNQTPETSSFQIPANPVIRDCVHIVFPQCSRRGGLDDGEYGLPPR
jgi:hypothetical protein